MKDETDFVPTDPELRYYAEHPESYAHVARIIDLIEVFNHRYRCIPPECDLGHPCVRHARSHMVAERYLRMKDRAR